MSAVASQTTTFVPSQEASSQQSPLLVDFPCKAVFQICRPKLGKITVEMGEDIHIGTLIPTEGDFLLVSFADQTPSAWEMIREVLDIATDRFEIPTLLLGHGSRESLSSALCGAQKRAARHSVTGEPNLETIFVPSQILLRILGITQETRVCNALVLVRNGHVHSTWCSKKKGNEPHSWDELLSMLG
ncbi:hypothetical protein HQ487_05465 [Candidatus Uhrbacteria bacterium]|nr:hypothetical protein [Candidatus Uhrbacteria bacterium]